MTQHLPDLPPPPDEPPADPAAAAAAGPVNSVDLEAEQRVLAALFAEAHLLDDLSEKVSAADFAIPAHEAIFDAMAACDASGLPIDVVTVADELTKRGDMGRVGGIDVLRLVAAGGQHDPEAAKQVISEAVTSFDAYADIVYDRATRRRLTGAARKIAHDASSGQFDARELIENAERRIYGVAADRSASSMQTMAQIVAATTARMATARTQRLVGVPTGFRALDDVTGGFQGGQMITVAGRPAMGKSVLTMQFLRHIADTTGDIVPVFSYEMPASDIALRLIAADSGVPLQLLMRGQIPDGMDRAVAHAAERLAASTLLIDDNPPRTVLGIRSALRRLSRRGKIGAVGADYMQLIGSDNTRRNGSRQEDVSEISRETKLMAGEFDVPYFAVSQLNRGLEARPNKRPMLSDLRESGAIEQDSNLILFVHRPSVYDPTMPENEAEIILAKNRNGATVTVYADWEGPQQRFRDTDRTAPAEAPAAARPAAGGGYGGGAPAGGGGYGGYGGVDPFGGY